jgi:uncharacterized protein
LNFGIFSNQKQKMKKEQIINKTAEFVKVTLSGQDPGHDWWHVYRVWKNSILIVKNEKADMFVVELAALLHDIADWKFHGGSDDIGHQMAREWLEKNSVNEIIISHVCQIIKDVSFKGAGVENKIKTLEGMIVQDADRLDAIGAIGIARSFSYGGHKGRELYNPKIKPVKHKTFEQYKKNNGPTINHFYEKLLLLKDMMNTATAKKIAEHRHKVMEGFLKEFLQEWDGKL